MKSSIVVSLVVLGIIVVGGGLAWAAAVGAARREEQTSRTWRTAARELGLTYSEGRARRTIEGVLDGVPVRVEYSCVVRGEANTRTIDERLSFCAGGDGQIPASLVVRKDSSLFGVRDAEIGDRSFDDLVELECVDAYVCAAFSDAARSKVASLLEAGGEVRNGKVLRETGEGDTLTLADLKGTLQSYAKLARLLAVSSGTLHERLARNATSDPSPGVRLQNLRCLVDPATRAPAELIASVSRKRLADQSGSVRLLAAKQVGSEGRPALLAIAASETSRTPWRVDALGALHEQSAPELSGLLSGLLTSSTPVVVCSALSVIAARGLDELSSGVMRCTSSEHATVRADAATTLAALSPEQAEAALFLLLADPSAEVQRASAEALGRVGSVAAVEPLLPLARALVPSSVRHAARDAVARIQSRLAPVGAGALTLVGDDDRAGAVTLAESSVSFGALSVAEPDAPEAGSAAGSTTATSDPPTLEHPGRR
jgi:HEAT repeat protein